MTDAEALDIAVARTGHERFRWLTSEENPDPESREGYRAHVRALAAGPRPPAPTFFEKAAGFVSAVAGHVAAGLPILSDEATAARLAVCESCEHKRGDACALCGCSLNAKASWADQHCPIRKWPGD